MRNWLLPAVTLVAFTAAVHAKAPTKDSIVGEWTISKTINGNKSDRTDTIVLRADGTYTWTLMGQPREGKFELKGTTLHLQTGPGELLWENIDQNGDQIVRKVNALITEEWTRKK
jgi:hypothetical protein